MNTNNPPQEEEQKPQVKEVIVRNLVSLVFLVIIVIFIRGSVIEAYRIPSESMVPTLMKKDYILVSKLSYGFRLPFLKKTLFRWSTPKRDDIVVFTREDYIGTPQEDEGIDNIIKRVIGLPGDKVQVKGSKVIINDKEYKDKNAIWQQGGPPSGNFGPVVVPDKHVFVMGDNRDRSKDSRFWEGSNFLPLENIKGRALFVYMSTNDLSRIGTVIR